MADDANVPFTDFEEKTPFFKKPKFWAIVLTLLLGVILAAIFYKTVIQVSMSTEEVGRSIQIVWQDSQWVDKKVRPDEVTIVPAITFKVKNVGQKPLQYVYFIGIFFFAESKENLSDGYMPALQKPLAPGQTSGDIFIKGSYGYRASSKAAFINNIAGWKDINVKIFAKTKHSGEALLGIFPIKKQIAGVNIVYQANEAASTSAPVEDSKKAE